MRIRRRTLLAPSITAMVTAIAVPNEAVGQLERLHASARVVALDSPGELAVARPSVRFHIESDDAISAIAAGVDVPIQYRVRVESGNSASTWMFESRLRLDAPR